MGSNRSRRSAYDYWFGWTVHTMPVLERRMKIKDKETIQLNFDSLETLAVSVRQAISRKKTLKASSRLDGGWDDGITEVVLEFEREETSAEMEQRQKRDEARRIALVAKQASNRATVAERVKQLEKQLAAAKELLDSSDIDFSSSGSSSRKKL